MNTIREYKKLYKDTYAQLEKLHRRLCDLVAVRNTAISAGDLAEAARVKNQILAEGSIFRDHVDAMRLLLKGHSDNDAVATWEDFACAFQEWLGRFSPVTSE